MIWGVEFLGDDGSNGAGASSFAVIIIIII